MRFWIVFVTICSLLSLPFSGSMAADNIHHAGIGNVSAMPSAAEHDLHISDPATDGTEHCPDSAAVTEAIDDCCYETASGPECSDCPPDCGHCAMSDHGSTAALTMQQAYSSAAVMSAVIGHPSFYQLLSGQPTPPPIIS